MTVILEIRETKKVKLMFAPDFYLEAFSESAGGMIQAK